MRIWDPETGNLLHSFGYLSECYEVSSSSDGKQLASGHFDGTIILWDLVDWD